MCPPIPPYSPSIILNIFFFSSLWVIEVEKGIELKGELSMKKLRNINRHIARLIPAKIDITKATAVIYIDFSLLAMRYIEWLKLDATGITSTVRQISPIYCKNLILFYWELPIEDIGVLISQISNPMANPKLIRTKLFWCLYLASQKW